MADDQNVSEINIGKHELKSSVSATPLHRSDVDSLVFVIFSVLLAFAIVFGNTIVMAAFKHNRKLRKRNNMFLISLACSDCLVGVVSLPLWICISGLGISKGEVLYSLFISFDIFSALTSVFHLTAISVERYVSVSRPFLYRRLSLQSYTGTIASTWVLAAVIASLTPLQGLFKLQRFYAPSFTIIGFIGPLIVISSMYAGIFRIARSLSRRTPGASCAASEINCRVKRHLRKEIKMAMTLAVVSVFFFLAWLPFYVLLVTAVYCQHCMPGYPGLQRLVDFVKWMHYSNSAVNPFIYALRDPKMRREFLQLLQFKGLSAKLPCLRSTRDRGSTNRVQEV
ncbi:hypothetical protein OS493_034223 [Desmophyllum pertusum]|uniref:G-protein coupled receptors family 1 profile domain-containing protein n=1 Tax=Desmophyllum pertusum TaxID=174260 RepID=A0A9W9Z7D7_9CNID|nr:hypothetical protein OS493_034223 [Desmophyllum pertusum]